jgi:hypothetical protein
MKKTVDLYSILSDIQARPGMYLGQPSIRLLRAYIDGIFHLSSWGLEEVEVISNPEFRGFHEWVKEKYGYFESTSGWCNMLLAQATVAVGFKDAEAYAMTKFFEDLEEFKGQKAKPGPALVVETFDLSQDDMDALTISGDEDAPKI